MPKQLSKYEQTVRAVGKRPLSRNQVADKLGVKPQAVAAHLGKAVNEGRIIKTDKGFQRSF